MLPVVITVPGRLTVLSNEDVAGPSLWPFDARGLPVSIQ